VPEVAELDNSPALPAIEGSAAAAILLMLLDESEAATILKQLDPDEVRQLAKAMFDTANASEQQIGQALDRFVTRSRDVSALAIGADTRIRTVINEAVGNVRADNILAAVAPQRSAASLEMLRWMDVDAISGLLASEHPQVGALILSVLVPDVAARAIETLDELLQADLVLRAAMLTSVPAAAIEDLVRAQTVIDLPGPDPGRLLRPAGAQHHDQRARLRPRDQFHLRRQQQSAPGHLYPAGCAQCAGDRVLLRWPLEPRHQGGLQVRRPGAGGAGLRRGDSRLP